MKRALVPLLVLTSISINCFATEIAPGVEKLYEYEELTGNAISGRIEKSNENVSFFGHRLTANTQAYSGSVNRNITMQGFHSIYLVNQTQSRQTYHIQIYLCSNKNDCFNYISGYELNPGASYSSGSTSTLTASFPNNKQFYVLTAGTVVSGAENGRATDSKYITIS